MTDLHIETPDIPKDLEKEAAYIPNGLTDEVIFTHLHCRNLDFYGQEGRLVEIRGSVFEKVNLGECHLEKASMIDAVNRVCDYSNARITDGRLNRIEFRGCKMLGVDFTMSYLKNIRFIDCNLRYALFRYVKFSQIEFVRCDLTEADFQAAELPDVRFRGCKLGKTQFSDAKLKDADFRGSEIEGIKVGIQELPGSVVDPFQALYLSTLLGFTIKDQEIRPR